jgi:hypothetical protein
VRGVCAGTARLAFGDIAEQIDAGGERCAIIVGAAIAPALQLKASGRYVPL